MKKTMLAFLTIFLLASCSKDDNPVAEDDGKLYYKFSNSDYNLMINYNYTPNQIITYQNQFGDQLHFKVISNETKKSSVYNVSYIGLGSYLKYYYDNKSIRLKIIENNAANDEYFKVIYHFSISEGVFKNAINLPIWNIYNATAIDETPINVSLYYTNNSIKTPLNINGHLFNRVVVIDSNSNTIEPNSSGGILDRNINKIYYDYDFGIIQFEDINGKQWKVIYP